MTTEVKEGEKKVLRNFRSTQEVEGFYRFVNDNGLRKEAKKVLELVHVRMKLADKKSKAAAKKAAKKASKAAAKK